VPAIFLSILPDPWPAGDRQPHPSAGRGHFRRASPHISGWPSAIATAHGHHIAPAVIIAPGGVNYTSPMKEHPR
jgi:hypothetical protein